MKYLLILEELILFGASVFFFSLTTDLSWIFYAGLFFVPDIAFLGYAINSKAGAIFYNFMHHKGVWLLIALAGYFAKIEWLLGIGIIFVGHSAFDRVFGYGLKYFDDFHNTHLGIIGNKST